MKTGENEVEVGERIESTQPVRQLLPAVWAGVVSRLCVCVAMAILVAGVTRGAATVLPVTVKTPPPAQSGYFKLGSNKNPAGHEISLNSRSLLFDGQPWFPVMGEMHYARVPQAEWREELLKMKAGGVDIVASYVFWIHHEEIQGQWDWSGQRDLNKFLQTCNDVGLKALVRCGPWCHGEVRNGGLPDWVVAHKDWKLRSTDPSFLAAVKTLYAQIAEQLKGELWKDGGPVIGIQVDNEFRGSPDYLMTLKRMAIDAGIDVPLYTRTGWPAMRTPPPLGELLPLFGAYPDGFWTRNLKPMDGNAWENFTFKITRIDTGVGNDTLTVEKSGDTSGTQKYPYLTCEIGGGMPASYHRRMNYDPRDVEAVVLCQLGSGSSLLGYYMYHGGQNPEGKRSKLQESAATGYPNDLPVKSYDFNAPIGEFGQINPQYYWLRRLHLFLQDFGPALSQMPATLPTNRVASKSDVSTVRWSVRSDGNSGYVFVNNYQRLQPMPPKTNVQFTLNLPDDVLLFPQPPITIPAEAFFFWPFNLDLDGAQLTYATAQPICRDGSTFYFAEIPGVNAEFEFAADTLNGKKSRFEDIQPSRKPAIQLKTPSGRDIQIVLLSDADSLALQKLNDGRVAFEEPKERFTRKVTVELLSAAGPAREIPRVGKARLAVAPTDDDFTNAAVWRVNLPAALDLSANPLLRIRYIGDVARLTLNGKLIADNFYAGREFDLGLRRYGQGILSGDLQLEILPLRQDAPVYVEPRNRPDFGTNRSLLKLESVGLVY